MWLGRVLADEPQPFHPLGLPTADTPPQSVVDLLLDPASIPAWGDVVAVHAGRLAVVRAALVELTDDWLPGPGGAPAATPD